MPLAHAQPAVLVVLIITDAVRHHLTDRPAALLAFEGVLILAVLAFGAELTHSWPRTRRSHATGTPAAAHRHRRWLRLHHWATQPLTYCAILCAAPIGTLWIDAGPWASYPVWAPWALVTHAHLRHRPARPWCPQCPI